jgi:hypothetical protein
MDAGSKTHGYQWKNLSFWLKKANFKSALDSIRRFVNISKIDV